MAEGPIVAVVNPRAANGRAGRHARRLERFLRAAGLDYANRFTRRPNDATRLTLDSINAGAEVVLSVGGDGTLNEVVNGFMRADAHDRLKTALAVAQVGTGIDFSRTVQQSPAPAQVLTRLRRRETKAIDVGLVEYINRAAQSDSRYFVNIAEFGSGGAVVEKVNRTTKVFGGRVSFLLAILSTLPKYRNRRVDYTLDDGFSASGIVNNFVVANGRYFGGGLLPAPRAELDDGVLDVVVIGDLDWKTIRRHLKDLRRGTHLSIPGVTYHRARELKTNSRERALLDLDGELVGYDPTRFVCLPRALRLLI